MYNYPKEFCILIYIWGPKFVISLDCFCNVFNCSKDCNLYPNYRIIAINVRSCLNNSIKNSRPSIPKYEFVPDVYLPTYPNPFSFYQSIYCIIHRHFGQSKMHLLYFIRILHVIDYTVFCILCNRCLRYIERLSFHFPLKPILSSTVMLY